MQLGTTRGDRSGFTLVELMVVVAIGGVFAAIALPAYRGYIDRSKTTEAVDNIRAMYDGLGAYFDAEHKSRGVNGLHNTKCLPEEAPQAEPFPVLSGGKKAVGDYTDETWKALGFRPSGPVYHSYYFRNDFGDSCGVLDMTGPNGSCNATHDWDEDGDLFGLALEWDVVDGTLLRTPHIIRADDLENPWE